MLIGLLSKKRMGKDTTADYLVNKYDFIKMTFAQPLKDICKILFMFTDEQQYGDKLKEEIDPRWDISPRTAYQYIGTDLFRDQLDKIMPRIGKDIWVYHLLLRYQETIKNNKNIVISDVRFENEVKLIHDLGGIIIKIDRDIENSDEHLSEREIDNIMDYDYIIYNIGTLTELYDKIDVFMEQQKKN